jgi:hypothetical protein
MPTYSYSLQYAESDIDDIDERGVGSATEILGAFDRFDWAAQVASANQLQKCSPTFYVKERETEREFWVSGYGEPEAPTFVNAYTYQGEIRRFFGLSRAKHPVVAPTRELSLEEARRCVRLFVDGDHESLLRVLAP